MTRSNPPNFSRQILLLAASVFLLAAPQGALAKHKDHSDDHGGMSSNDSSEDHGDKQSEDPKNKVSEKHKGKHKEESADNGMDSEKQKSKHKDKESADNGMSSEKHKGKHKHDEESADNGMNSRKHKGKNKEQAEKTNDPEQDKTTGTVSTTNGNTPTAFIPLRRRRRAWSPSPLGGLVPNPGWSGRNHCVLHQSRHDHHIQWPRLEDVGCWFADCVRHPWHRPRLRRSSRPH